MEGYKMLGNAYLNGEPVEVSCEAKSLLCEWVEHEYSQLPFEVEYVPWLPILPGNVTEIRNQIVEGKLHVFNGGSESAWCDHETNLKLRAVHDYHHALCKSDFTFEGEYATYEFGSRRLVSWAWERCTPSEWIVEAGRVLFSEIVLQAAAYFVLGDFPDTQKIVFIGGNNRAL